MTTNLIKEISVLLQGSEDDLWNGLTRLAKKRAVSAVNLKLDTTSDVRSAYYIYSCGTQVVFLLLDTLLSADKDELADEEGYGEEPPLYFTSSCHRESPVFSIWREAQLWIKSNPGNTDEILCVVLTNSFIINYEGASDDWNLADVSVRHNNLFLNILGDEGNRDICVILAGYVNLMRSLLQTNVGLFSRFPNIFIFNDFSFDELLEIAIRRIERTGYSLTEGGLYQLCTHIRQMDHRSKSFGNAREIANLCEQIFINHAIRCMEENVEPSQLLEITAEDIAASSVNTNILQTERKYIGFK